jgi:hypothetical protein
MICSYLTVMKLFAGYSLSDRPLLLFGVFLALLGVQFICLGILAEIQIRSYHESSKRYTYSIREVLRAEQSVQSNSSVVPLSDV